MDVLRISILSLLILCMPCMHLVVTGTDLAPKYGLVGETIDLRCPSAEIKSDDIRSWYRGKFDVANLPPEKNKIFRGRLSSGELIKGDMNENYMSLDQETFTMSLTVQDDPHGNEFFTCGTDGLTKEFDTQEVLIYLQPEVSITTDRPPDAGVNVTVTCAVQRLYPNITSDQFAMRWGVVDAAESVFSAALNDDGSIKYTLEKSKNLTREDDGLTVTCTVTPASHFGEPATASLTLNFTMGEPEDPGASTGGGSNVGAIVGGVIGGLAAIVIIVVIIGVLVKKKKPKREKTSESIRGKTNKRVKETYIEANQEDPSTPEQEEPKPYNMPKPVQQSPGLDSSV